MDGIDVRGARAGEEAEIARLHNEAFASWIRRLPPVFRQVECVPGDVGEWPGKVFVAAIGSRLVGYANAVRTAEGGTAFPSTDEHGGQSRIGVLPDWRRRRVGRALVARAAEGAWSWIGAYSDNDAATGLLTACGFRHGKLDRPCPGCVVPGHTDDSVLATRDLGGPLPRVPAVPGLRVREAREDDVEDLRLLFGESRPLVFGPRPTADDVRGWMRSGWAETILVAELEGGVVGSMEFRARGVLGITGVRPAFRGRGIGAALLAETLALMKERGLDHVLADTGWFDADAIRLYGRLGFDNSRWLFSWMRPAG